MTNRHTSLEISKTANNQFMVKLKGSNGRVLMQSECYKTLASAEHLVDLLNDMLITKTVYKKEVFHVAKTDRSVGGGKKVGKRNSVLPNTGNDSTN